MREPYERLRRARERAGYPGPAAAARAFGWNEHTYKSHENGNRGFKRASAEKYAAAFHVSAVYLLMGEKRKRGDLSPDEHRFVTLFRSMSKDDRETIMTLLEVMNRQKSQKRPDLVFDRELEQ